MNKSVEFTIKSDHNSVQRVGSATKSIKTKRVKRSDKENAGIAACGGGALKKSLTPVVSDTSKRLPLRVLNIRVADVQEGRKTVRFGNVHVLSDSDKKSSTKVWPPPIPENGFLNHDRGENGDFSDDSLMEKCMNDEDFFSILSDDYPAHGNMEPYTPVNCAMPDPLQNIKKVRRKSKPKCSYSTEKLEEDLNLIFNTGAKKMHETNATSSTMMKLHCIEEKPREKYTYIVPGAVYLDPRENYVFHAVLYSSVHIEDIVKNIFRKQFGYRLSDTFLKKYVITEMNRSIVVNWLLKLQTYMKTEHVLVYTAVRLMDVAIDKMQIPLKQLQLVALAAFWISLKFHATDHKDAKWLVNQTGGAYKREELAMMERTVFHLNNFDVNCIDISVLIHYYILKLEIKHADIVSQCCHYLVDCSLLDSYFVRILPSMLAAGSVLTSLFLLKQYDHQLWAKLKIYNGYYRPEELMSIKWKLIEVLMQVNDPLFPCREPCFKYCSSKYCGVSQIVADFLETQNP